MTKHASDAIQSRCSWPSLNEPFATALRDAVDFICWSFEPVGILATGTIVRGCAHRSSDLDLHVVHLAPHRRRVQRFFNGVPAEIFVNPPSAVRAYFVDEDRDGRRITAHMLTTGIVIFQADAIVDELRKEAAQWLVKETRQLDSESTGTRYSIASQLEDALDLIGIDDVTGWTSPAQADAYEALLREEVFRRIAARLSDGYRGIELLRGATEDKL